jgi:hypothetical protein
MCSGNRRVFAGAFFAALLLRPLPAQAQADAKLYADQNFTAAVTGSLPKGTPVRVNGCGECTDLDGSTAKWAQVTTASGKTGWVFSGFLEERPK